MMKNKVYISINEFIRIDTHTLLRFFLSLIFNVLSFLLVRIIFVVMIPFLFGICKEFFRDRKIVGRIEWNDVITDMITLLISITIIMNI